MQDFNISSNREHTLLTERYRPDTLEGFLGNDKLLLILRVLQTFSAFALFALAFAFKYQ